MQEHTLVHRADLKSLADLVSAVADHISQGHHKPLRFRQGSDRALDDIEGLARGKLRLRHRSPIGRKRLPPAGIGLTGTEEAIRLDQWLIIQVRERRERQRAPFAHSAVAGDVGDDLQDPGAQRRATLEPVEPLQHREPCLLHDLLRYSAQTNIATCDREHRWIERTDDVFERAFISITETANQHGVVSEGSQATGAPDHALRLLRCDPRVETTRLLAPSPCNKQSAGTTKEGVRAPRMIAMLALVGLLTITPLAATATGAQAPALTARASSYGRILFDRRGFALYAFSKDPPGHSNCAGACAKRWPPYLVTRSPRAGRSVTASLIGTIRRKGGRLQASYAGKPLYRYVGDRRPLQVLCQNVNEFGGLWLVLRPNGTVVR